MILEINAKNTATLLSKDVDPRTMEVFDSVHFCAGTFQSRRAAKRWAKANLPTVKVEFTDWTPENPWVLHEVEERD